VADECSATLVAYGISPLRIIDVGVAGIHRLLASADQIAEADVGVVVAGLEGALASVVAGLTAAPVVAVPTSVGYGAALEGVTALLGMLASCASGLTVVGIDNGFGAASAVMRILSAAPAKSSLANGAAHGEAEDQSPTLAPDLLGPPVLVSDSGESEPLNLPWMAIDPDEDPTGYPDGYPVGYPDPSRDASGREADRRGWDTTEFPSVSPDLAQPDQARPDRVRPDSDSPS
jgi:phosphoribosylcarboxyaminoimidazole (NCAIR) mutase